MKINIVKIKENRRVNYPFRIILNNKPSNKLYTTLLYSTKPFLYFRNSKNTPRIIPFTRQNIHMKYFITSFINGHVPDIFDRYLKG